MVTHLSARLVWHDSGWDGRVCQNPAENSSCVMHEHVRENKDDEFEESNAEVPLDELNPADLPPCSRDPGAFSPDGFTHLHTDPLDWRSHPPISEDIPPYSFCTSPYGELQDDDGWINDAEESEQIIADFFGELTTDLSLVFFYAKDGHPLAEDGRRVLVGVGRISDIGRQLHYPNTDDPVWSRRVTHEYGEEGVRLPYQEYLNEGHDVENIICEVPSEETDSFSYVANHVSDDTAIGTLERLLESLRAVKREDKIEGEWDEQIEWVEQVLTEAWEHRGIYPGLESVLEYLEADGTGYQRKVLSGMVEHGENPLDHVIALLEEEEEARGEFDSYQFMIAQQKWADLDDDRQELLKTLSGFDLTPDQVSRIFQSAGDRGGPVSVTIDELEEDLYLLFERDRESAEENPISFETVDRGMRLDPRDMEFHPPGFLRPVPENDKKRVRALLISVLQRASENGDTVLHLDEAIQRARDFLPEERQCNPSVSVIQSEIEFFGESLVINEEDEQTSIALPRLHRMEEEIEDVVRDLSSQTIDRSQFKWRELLDDVLGEADTEVLDEEIEEAAREEKTRALETLHSSRFAVLMGGAGTGKTTVVNSFLQGLDEVEGQASKLLLAPTGKARVRLEEAAGEEANTIHSFLSRRGWLGDEFTLREKGEETGGARTVIVDEASMLPTDLLATLFRALDMNIVKRLVLIGDPNQLPPIGPGRPFFDIIRWLEEEHQECIAELEQQVRYRGNQGAARELADVFAGENPELNDEILADVAKGSPGEDLEVRFWEETDDLYDELGTVLENILDQFGGSADRIDAFDRSVGYDSDVSNVESWQILSPTRIDTHGTRALNRRIQSEFRGHRLDDNDVTSVGDEQFVPGDKVIQTVNNRQYAPHSDSYPYVANGEIGVVAETRPVYETGNVYVRFTTQDDQISYPNGELKGDSKLELAYGLTVHKAQGSEFGITVLVLPKEAPTLSRELLYTGLTRYQEKLVLMIQEDTSKLYELSRPEKSELRHRSTRLFETSIRAGPDVPYPENLIHQTKNGEEVRSKSEVIIADTLQNLGISYEYEKQLTPEDDPEDYRWPDFTVSYEGDTYYWEHLGLLHKPDYREKWERKREWYDEHGLSDQLITSRDTPEGGIDSGEIEEIARHEILEE